MLASSDCCTCILHWLSIPGFGGDMGDGGFMGGMGSQGITASQTPQQGTRVRA